MAKKARQRKRRVRGRDWHGWALKLDGLKDGQRLCHWAEPGNKPEPDGGGKWVRVKFVEVD